MSPIYLLWDSSCKLIIYCGTHPPELIKYRPIRLGDTVYQKKGIGPYGISPSSDLAGIDEHFEDKAACKIKNV